MLGTRYEEYINFSDDIPFKFFMDIERNSSNFSSEMNWHDNLEIEFCISGKGFVILDGKKFGISEKDVIVVNSNVMHYTGSNDALIYACLIVDSGFCKKAGIDQSKLRFNSKFHSEEFVEWFEQLKKVYLDIDDVCRLAKLRVIVLNMLIELREKYVEETDFLNTDSCETVKKTIKFIRENFNRKISLDEIAKNLFLNKYTLSREFKKITRQTIVQYTNSYRCQMAAALIEDGASVADAAQMCGFENMSFFTKTFKTYMGELPSKIKGSRRK